MEKNTFGSRRFSRSTQGRKHKAQNTNFDCIYQLKKYINIWSHGPGIEEIAGILVGFVKSGKKTKEGK